jgi:CDP-glycerol glycerophosphotransferase
VTQQPDVSVVVIVYNDAERLPTAVRSALRQTQRALEVIIVDDASTDATPEVARALAAADPRVRVLRLAANSGGCSAPRNAGIEAARAPFLMFLDSDDVYPRRAVARLLAAARRTGADLVAGLAVRDNRATGRVGPWYPRLYDRAVTYRSIREHPLQLHDTISVNKLYARRFLDEHRLRFPEGVLYEDQLFTVQAYSLAGRMAIVPRLVYRWVIAGDPDNPSITNRRHELENFVHRLAVNRRIDAFLEEHGLADLRVEKDYKFLKHDLRLYLNDLSAHDEEHQKQFLALAGPYVETLARDALVRGSWIERITWDGVTRQDLPGTLAALGRLRHRKLTVNLTRRGGRTWWPGGEPADHDRYDVTGVGFQDLPFGELPLHSAATDVEIDGSTVRLTGRTLNQLGRLDDGDGTGTALSLVLRRRGIRREASVPVTVSARGEEAATWTARLDLAALLPGTADRGVAWDVLLRADKDGATNLSAVSVDERLLGADGLPTDAGVTVAATTRAELVLAPPAGRPTGLPARVADGRRRLRRAYQVARNTGLLTARPAVLWAREARRALRGRRPGPDPAPGARAPK